MAKDRQIRIVHGSFGRATLHRISGPLVAHAHAEFHLIFKIGGTDATFKIDGQPATLTDGCALLINPWSTHAKSAKEGSPSLLLALLLEPEWLGRTLGVDNPAGGLHFSKALVRMDADTVTSLTALGTCLARDLADDSAIGSADCEAAVANLARRVSACHLQRRSMTEVLANTRPLDYRIKRATEYIRSHAGKTPTLKRSPARWACPAAGSSTSSRPAWASRRSNTSTGSESASPHACWRNGMPASGTWHTNSDSARKDTSRAFSSSTWGLARRSSAAPACRAARTATEAPHAARHPLPVSRAASATACPG